MNVGMLPSWLNGRRWPRQLSLCLLSAFSVLISLSLIGSVIYAQTATTPAAQEQEVNGYEYTVQPGDNWSSVAARTNVTVEALKAANPRAAGRSSGWLITGERLFIPVATRMMTKTHVVEYGDSWSTIAKAYGISMQLLKAANPKSLRYDDVLYRGETLFVPLVDEGAPLAVPTDDPAVTSSTPASSEAAEGGNAEVEDTDTATTTPTVDAANGAETPVADESIADANGTPEPTVAVAVDTAAAATATAEAARLSCPDDSVAYPSQLLALLDRGGDTTALAAYLAECDSSATATVANEDFNGDGLDDYVVIFPLSVVAEAMLQESADASSTNQLSMDLIILNSGPEGYTVGYQARAESAVQLLSTADINRDGQADVSWTETTCGSSDCFQTILLYSWDGGLWRNWTAEKITMANATIRLVDVTDEGDGMEVLIEGGVYEREAAGPQRARQEIWGSVAGAPYSLLSTTVTASNCLYHTVLDANAALLTGGADNFATAEAYYTKVISDDTLVACGTHPDEIAELRSFGIYRLALISAYQGMPEIVSDLVDNLSLAFPGSLYDQVGQLWLKRYQENYDVDAACRAVEEFAVANPATLAVLADYGFANPTFTVTDLCPRLDVTIPPLSLPTPEPPTPLPPTATPEEEPIPEAELTPTEAASVDSAAADAATADDSAPTEDNNDAANANAPVSLNEDGLPVCPENLAGYSAALPILLQTAAGDSLVVETWLRSCDALDDERGSFRLVDLNGDRVGDAIFLPTIVSDLGFGRNGAQGAVLIYHGEADGTYALVANPEIYGEPRLLTIDDLNNDRVPDIAWSIEGCSSFCVLEVQIVSWAADTYTNTIAPGATITEGEAQFEPVPQDSRGRGQQLVLRGGVSGTPDGGLAVPHTEIWQSINRGPYQRISWAYDRTVAESNCMGLHLVEADVALQAASLIGYDTAIDLYSSSIDPTLKACSIYGMDEEEELTRLQGLASFRLIEAQALSGDLPAAHTTLERLQQGQPEGDFAAAAESWLTQFERDGDAAAACAELMDTFTENDDLWQITDNYGYNHPALGPEQICFVPAGQ